MFSSLRKTTHSLAHASASGIIRLLAFFFIKSGLGGSRTVTAHIWSAEARSRLLLTALGGTGFSSLLFLYPLTLRVPQTSWLQRSANHSCSLSAIFDSCRSLQTRSSPPGPSNPINPQPKGSHWHFTLKPDIGDVKHHESPASFIIGQFLCVD